MAAASDSAEPHSIILWEFMNNINMWEPYEPKIVEYLESNSLANSSTPLSLGFAASHLKDFVVIFSSASSGVQLNVHTGVPRQVRRRLIFSMDGGVARGVLWQWQENARCWRFYPTEISQLIEKSREQKCTLANSGVGGGTSGTSTEVPVVGTPKLSGHQGRKKENRGKKKAYSSPSSSMSRRLDSSGIIDAPAHFPSFPYILDFVNCIQTCTIQTRSKPSRRLMRRQTDVHFPRTSSTHSVPSEAPTDASFAVTEAASTADCTTPVSMPFYYEASPTDEKSEDSDVVPSSLQCVMCFERKINCVFDCGHVSCLQCAQLITDCHICRRTIVNRKRLFL